MTYLWVSKTNITDTLSLKTSSYLLMCHENGHNEQKENKLIRVQMRMNENNSTKRASTQCHPLQMP
jgi:hypothetical protein